MEFRLLIFLGSLLIVSAFGAIVVFRRWQVVERLMGEELLVEEAMRESLEVTIQRSVGNTPPPVQNSILLELINY